MKLQSYFPSLDCEVAANVLGRYSIADFLTWCGVTVRAREPIPSAAQLSTHRVGMRDTALTHPQPRDILVRSSPGAGASHDRLATPSESQQQAAHCRTRAHTATDEGVRAL
jgi:hypothetical protein